jgi:hypothetical protein
MNSGISPDGKSYHCGWKTEQQQFREGQGDPLAKPDAAYHATITISCYPSIFVGPHID